MQSPNFNTTRLGSYLAGWPNTNALSRNSLFCFLFLFFSFSRFFFPLQDDIIDCRNPVLALCNVFQASVYQLFFHIISPCPYFICIYLQYRLESLENSYSSSILRFSILLFGKRVRLNRKKRRLREMSYLWPGHYIVIISFSI